MHSIEWNKILSSCVLSLHIDQRDNNAFCYSLKITHHLSYHFSPCCEYYKCIMFHGLGPRGRKMVNLMGMMHLFVDSHVIWTILIASDYGY